MSKNDKKNRTDGAVVSGGLKIPAPTNSFNNPASPDVDLNINASTSNLNQKK